MNYLKQILLASLMLSFVVLTAGVAAAEVGIPFGLKWGDSPETVEKTCKKLFGECTKKKRTGEDALQIDSDISIGGFKFKVGFYFFPDKTLDTINVISLQKFENPYSRNEFINVVNKYFIDPFDSLPEYRKVRTINNKTIFFTPNSRLEVDFGPPPKEIDKEGKSLWLMIAWMPLEIETFFIK